MSEQYLDLDEDFLFHLGDPKSLSAITAEKLSPNLIADEFVRDVFEWQIEHLRDNKVQATAGVLSDEFDIEFEEPQTAIGDLIGRLRERWVKNNARDIMKDLAQVYQDNPSDIAKVMIDKGKTLSKILQTRGEQFGTGDFERAIKRYDELVLQGPGPSFGFDLLDRHFHGMRGLTYLLASPGTYKSWISTNAALENIKNGKNVWIYSLELPAEEADMRLRCMAADIPFWKYLNHSLSQTDKALLRETSELLDSLGVYQVVKPQPGHRSISRLIETAQDAGADAVFIDQLQYVETNDGKALGSCDTREYWQPCDIARNYSDETPLWLVHQFNRQAMFADSMPEMQNAKASAAIEETATLSLGLWANKDMRKSRVLEIGTLKSRHYQYTSWEIGVELTKGCNFSMLGESDDE